MGNTRDSLLESYDVTVDNGDVYTVETEPTSLASFAGDAARSISSAMSHPLVSMFNPRRDLVDPLGIKQGIASIPAPSVTLPIAGGFLGGRVAGIPGGVIGAEAGQLIGRELQRAQDTQAGRASGEPPPILPQVGADLAFLSSMSAGAYLPEVSAALEAFPAAHMISTGVGAGVGELMSQMILGKKRDLPEAISQGVQGAALTGLVSKAMQVAKAIPEFLRANRLRLRLKIGQNDVSHALQREGFLKTIQQDVDNTIDTSGELTTMKVKGVSAVDATHVSDSLQALAEEDPKLQKAILKAADDIGKGQLVREYFPELTVDVTRGAESADPAILEGRRTFRRQILQNLRESGQISGRDVSNLTGDDAHQIRRVFREIFREALDRKQDLTFTQRNALRLSGEMKEALLKADPSLQEDFTRHKGLMDRFRQVESKLKDLNKLESTIEQHFEGSGSQAAFEQLLSPEVREQALDFMRAHDIGKFNAGIVWRALRFGAMTPIYLMFSGARSALRQASK